MFSILKLKFHPSISFCLSGAKSLRQQSKQRTLDLCPHPSLPAYPRKHRGVPSWEASTQWHMPGTLHLTRRDPGQKLKPTELVPFEKGEIKTEITYWIYTQPSSSVFFWSTTVIFNLTAWGFQVLLQCILAPADCKTVQETVGWISSKVPCCFKNWAVGGICYSLDVPVRWYWIKTHSYWGIKKSKHSTSRRQVAASLLMIHRNHKLSPTRDCVSCRMQLELMMLCWLWYEYTEKMLTIPARRILLCAVFALPVLAMIKFSAV